MYLHLIRDERGSIIAAEYLLLASTVIGLAMIGTVGLNDGVGSATNSLTSRIEDAVKYRPLPVLQTKTKPENEVRCNTFSCP